MSQHNPTREAVNAVLHKIRTASPDDVGAPWHAQFAQRVRSATARDLLSRWWCCALLVFVLVFLALLLIRPPFSNNPSTRKPHWGRMFVFAAAFSGAAGLACRYGCNN